MPVRTRLRSIPALLIAAALFTACGSNSEPVTSASARPVATVSGDTLIAKTIGSIPNVHTTGAFIFSGQPAPADFAALRSEGVTTVVNLRPDAEMGGFDEAAAASESGMSYLSIPWNGPDQLTDTVFAQTRDVLRGVEGKALLHCASANRVGAVWIPFRVLDQGVDLEQAVREARAIGMRTDAYEQIARDYVARNK